MEELCKDILFYNKEHKKFFCRNFPKCRDFDVYHMVSVDMRSI